MQLTPLMGLLCFGFLRQTRDYVLNQGSLPKNDSQKEIKAILFRESVDWKKNVRGDALHNFLIQETHDLPFKN